MKMLRSRPTLIARLLAVAAAALLAACASTAPVAAYGDVDYAKVAQIERAARTLGTQVIWIHYPAKRSDSATQ
jgi:uncharacterized lipoprotein YmbA